MSRPPRAAAVSTQRNMKRVAREDTSAVCRHFMARHMELSLFITLFTTWRLLSVSTLKRFFNCAKLSLFIAVFVRTFLPIHFLLTTLLFFSIPLYSDFK